MAIAPKFAMQDQFTMDKENAFYTLSIELVVAIDYILLQIRISIFHFIAFLVSALIGATGS